MKVQVWLYTSVYFFQLLTLISSNLISLLPLSSKSTFFILLFLFKANRILLPLINILFLFFCSPILYY